MAGGPLIVSAAAYPTGVMCLCCQREIMPGEQYKLRSYDTGKVEATTTAEQYTADSSNYPVHYAC
jgi:hypothetical protein